MGPRSAPLAMLTVLWAMRLRERSMPVLRFFVQAQLALEWARNFSLHEVAAQMQPLLALAADGATGA